MSYENKTLRELYEESLSDKNINIRPFASPGAAAQEKYNNSLQWELFGSALGPYINPLEYTHWWEESLALRNAAILGDWSFVDKFRITGPDAPEFMNYTCTKDLSNQEVNHVN